MLRHPFAGTVVEVFSGSGRLSAALRRQGWVCPGFDIKCGSNCDFCETKVLDRLLNWINVRWISGIWLVVPCSIYRSARQLERGPIPVRTVEFPNGLPNLLASEQRLVDASNILIDHSILLARVAYRHFVPGGFENLEHSLVFHVSKVPQFPQFPCVRSSAFHFCQYGGRRRKATLLLAWFLSGYQRLRRRCEGTARCCNVTHIISYNFKGQELILCMVDMSCTTISIHVM